MREFARAKAARETQNTDKIDLLQRYMRRFEVLGPQDGKAKKDAHLFDDAPKARAFLASDSTIDAPVFVKGGANYSLIDPISEERPIAQFLDLLHNPKEPIYYCDDKQIERLTSIGTIAQHFRTQRHVIDTPWNFPDIVNPMFDHAVPSFVMHPRSTALHDIMRIVTDVTKDDICHCPESEKMERRVSTICRKEHFATEEEFFETYQIWRSWQGTVLIAEPGAITYPHFDRFALATWISCLEGEIAFAWLSHPSPRQNVGWLCDREKVRGKWLFTVLRAGDALYMPPGLVHFVWRRPKGGPTLGCAGHLIRCNDLAQWLRNLSTEVSLYALIDDADTSQRRILPSMLAGVISLVERAKDSGREARYGDEADLREIAELVKQVSRKLRKAKKDHEAAA